MLLNYLDKISKKIIVTRLSKLAEISDLLYNFNTYKICFFLKTSLLLYNIIVNSVMM